MRWLTLDYIHEHSRIDYNCDDASLDLYGNAAENVVLAVIRRTLNNVIDIYGKIPPALFHAALMLVDLSYTQKSPVSTTNLSVIPYTFDMVVADLMRLDEATDLQAERNTLLSLLDDIATDLDSDYGDIETPTDEQTEAYTEMKQTIAQTALKYLSVENPTEKVCGKLRTKVKEIKTACETLFN